MSADRSGHGPGHTHVWWTRLAPLVGYLVLAAGLALALGQTRELAHREIVRCADPGGDLALRHQWQRVVRIYGDVQAHRLTAEQARTAFISTYQQSLAEAGPVPPCLEVTGER